MNKPVLKPAVLVLACMMMSTVVYADDLQNGCDIKKAKIERQLEYAKKYGNTNRVAGLQRALANINAYCTNSGVNHNLNKKVAEKENKLAEREADLRAAQAKGDLKKIAKQQRKVEEARIELNEAKANLSGKGNADYTKYAKRVANKQQKVTEREIELKEAKARGDANRISQKERRLEQAQQELNEAKARLANYK